MQRTQSRNTRWTQLSITSYKGSQRERRGDGNGLDTRTGMWAGILLESFWNGYGKPREFPVVSCLKNATIAALFLSSSDRDDIIEKTDGKTAKALSGSGCRKARKTAMKRPGLRTTSDGSPSFQQAMRSHLRDGTLVPLASFQSAMQRPGLGKPHPLITKEPL